MRHPFEAEPPRLRARPDTGSALVEFALSLTVFLMTLLGTAEFGLLVFQYNILSDLAQEGVRRAAVCGSTRGTSMDCDVVAFVRSRSLGLNPDVYVYTVDANNACTTTNADLITLPASNGVCVKVTKNFGRLTQIVPLPANVTLQATAQMIIAR